MENTDKETSYFQPISTCTLTMPKQNVPLLSKGDREFIIQSKINLYQNKHEVICATNGSVRVA